MSDDLDDWLDDNPEVREQLEADMRANESADDFKHPWWTMSGESFMEALRRAHDGDDPEMIYLEWMANSEVEKPE